jgi:hypothetical protein
MVSINMAEWSRNRKEAFTRGRPHGTRYGIRYLSSRSLPFAVVRNAPNGWVRGDSVGPY